MKKIAINTEELQNIHNSMATNFKISRSQIEEMYKDDQSIVRNVNQNKSNSGSIGSLTIDSFNTNYFNVNNLETIRGYSREAYSLYPIYATVIETLSNMYYYRYTFFPRSIKEKSASADYAEIYNSMAEIVDGINIETIFPHLLSKLFVDGSLFLTTVKRTGSKTITTLTLPPRYCRLTGKTQFGTNVFQFDFSYFDSLGLSKEQVKEILKLYPDEMSSLYELYSSKGSEYQWQKLNPKFSAGFTLNDQAFPTYLRSLGAIMQYDQYRNNELERSEQQLIKIIAHKMPTWEDKLVVEVPEMMALHKNMAKTLTRNKYVRMLTTFGDLDVLSIGDDQTKENKTLQNAYSSIFNVDGENENLFNGSNKESLEFSLRRKESIVWKHVQEFVSFYTLVINNHYNFKGYQCSLNMLPLSVYNFDKVILQYKEGATLGTSKLEYVVSLGTKQIDIPSKVQLETYLELDKLTPLSTSYTGGKNASGIVSKTQEPVNDTKTKEDDDVKDTTTTIEVQDE